MGLFDDLFGSKNTTTANNATTGNSTTTGQQSQTNQTQTAQQTNQQQTQNTSSQTASNTQQASTGVNTVSSLDTQTIATLQSLLQPLAAQAGGSIGNTSNSDAIKKISSDFYAKATGGNNATVKAATDASAAKARLDFETGEGAQVNQIAQAIGSKGNTYSQLIKDKGLNDLNTQIAQITASGALQADQLNSSDLKAASDAIVQASQVAGNDASSTINPVLQIAQLLKGATSTSTSQENTGSSTQSQTAEQQLATVLSSIFGTQTGQSDTTQAGTLSTVSNTTGTEQTKGSKGIIGDILSIF